MVNYKTFRHFKGELYDVVMTATMESTGEELIIYRKHVDGLSCFTQQWARTRSNFFEEVEVDGEMVPRFKWIKEELTNDHKE